MKITDLLTQIKENSFYALMLLLVIVGVFVVALVAELLIKKATKDKEKILPTRKIAVIGMFAALSAVLMIFEIPVPFLGIPDIYKFEIGDLPAVICGFAYGPVAGVLVELLKILIKILFKSTSTAFVGEIANFAVGSAYVLPAVIVYWIKKTKKNAIMSVIIGAICMIITGALLNAYFLLPVFAKMFHMELEAIVGMGSAVNPWISSLPTFILFATVPINLLKSAVVSILVILLYKPLRPVIKGKTNK